ncbi:MAG: cadherin repeat domain-containing protein [Verrucomicrobiota bacterium]
MSGSTTLSGSTAIVGSAVTLSGPVTVNGSTTFEVKDTVTISGSLTANPAGSAFVKTGPGTLVINGANFNGPIIVLQGTVEIRGANFFQCLLLGGQGSVSGNGSFNCLISKAGSTLRPGASPGALTLTGDATWEAGSIYDLEINNATGTAGTDPGWDTINIGGTLTLSGTPEQLGNLLSGQIIIALKSLTSGNADGPMANFNNTTPYSWTIASAAGGITGFNSAAIQLDTNGIANDLGGGVFTISKPNTTDLVVNFIPAAQLAAPSDIVLLGTTITEANNFGASIGQIAALDANPSDNHTYTLVSGTGATDNTSFSIVGNTLQAAAVFDYEVKNSYSIRVRATDAGGLFTEKQFTITVTNVVETTTFQPGQISFVDGKIQLKLQSSGNLLWRIEASNDLSTWTTITTTTPGLDGILNFVDPDSASHPRRYYRAVLVPN